MNYDKRLYFVGHTGAGKALVAKTVAEKLGWQFINADLSLEFRIGRTLEEILGYPGAEAFYECQGEILASHLNKEHLVVSTDPSIVCSEKNRQLLAEAFVVYLQVSPVMQQERNTRNPASLMPIIDLNQFVIEQHKLRDHWYEEVADLTINSDENDLERHVQIIINKIKLLG